MQLLWLLPPPALTTATSSTTAITTTVARVPRAVPPAYLRRAERSTNVLRTFGHWLHLCRLLSQQHGHPDATRAPSHNTAVGAGGGAAARQ